MKTLKLKIYFEEDIELNGDDMAHCVSSEGKIRFNDLRQVLKSKGIKNWQNLHHYKIPSQDKRQ